MRPEGAQCVRAVDVVPLAGLHAADHHLHTGGAGSDQVVEIELHKGADIDFVLGVTGDAHAVLIAAVILAVQCGGCASIVEAVRGHDHAVRGVGL